MKDGQAACDAPVYEQSFVAEVKGSKGKRGLPDPCRVGRVRVRSRIGVFEGHLDLAEISASKIV